MKAYRGSGKRWYVVTPTGLPVFEGSRVECKQYLKQAHQKGSPEGFLRIIDLKQLDKED